MNTSLNAAGDSKLKLAALAPLMAAVFLTACGGGDSASTTVAAQSSAPAPSSSPSPSPAPSPGTSPAPSPSAPPAPAPIPITSASTTATATGLAWTKIADEGQSFTVNGTATVRFGRGGFWFQKTVTSSGDCSAASFGGDPLGGVLKICQVLVTTPVAAATAPGPYPKDGFCGTSGVAWAWCEDFDGQGMGAQVPFVPANSGIAFQKLSHMTVDTTTCEQSANGCQPYVLDGSLRLNAEDSGFGMNVMRVEQPFDFAGREGHIHYRSDFRGHPRMHQAVHISPGISNSLPDLRFASVLEALNMAPAISIDYVGDGGQPIPITLWRNGQKAEQFLTPGPLNLTVGQLHDIDIYISRTSVRVVIDGREVANEQFADIGFDRAYVYISQLAYNAPKFFERPTTDADHRFIWDNLAFDGPSLPRNSLTPVGKQDVLFRAWNAASCSVRGVAADGPVNPTNNMIFDTWRVQLDASAPAVAPSDISCVQNSASGPLYGLPWVGDDIDVVKR